MRKGSSLKRMIGIAAGIALVAAVAGCRGDGSETPPAATSPAGPTVPAAPATRTPSDADVVFLESELHTMRLNLLSVGVDASNELPELSMEGDGYSLTTADGDSYTWEFYGDIADAGVIGTNLDSYCIWVTTEAGVTMHINQLQVAAQGACQ